MIVSFVRYTSWILYPLSVIPAFIGTMSVIITLERLIGLSGSTTLFIYIGALCVGILILAASSSMLYWLECREVRTVEDHILHTILLYPAGFLILVVLIWEYSRWSGAAGYGLGVFFFLVSVLAIGIDALCLRHVTAHKTKK